MASRTPSPRQKAAPAPRKAVRDSVATRSAILDSAEKIFARDGLRSTRTEEIAAGSGVTKAMIHYYFDTKEALYQAVLDRVFQDREQGMDFNSLRRLPPVDALQAFVERLLQQMVAKPHLGPLFALENIQNDGAFYSRNGGKLFSTGRWPTSSSAAWRTARSGSRTRAMRRSTSWAPACTSSTCPRTSAPCGPRTRPTPPRR